MEAEKTHASTKEAARMLCVQPQTMRRGCCLFGNYLGMIPVKLSNGRLLWSLEAIRNILEKD